MFISFNWINLYIFEYVSKFVYVSKVFIVNSGYSSFKCVKFCNITKLNIKTKKERAKGKN